MRLSAVLVAGLLATPSLAQAERPALARTSSTALPPRVLAPWPVRLQTDVAKAQRRFRGEFALYVKDLKTGQRYTYNAATPMYLASGIKVPVMVALFKEVAAKRMSLDDELVLGPDDVRDGAPLLNYLRVGTPVTLRILLEAMIQQSDNAATDMIIDHLGVDMVNEVLPAEGVKGFGPITTLIDVRRLVYRELDPRTAHLSPRDIFRLRVTKPLKARLDKLAGMLDEAPGYFTPRELDRAYKSYYAQGFNSAPVEAMGALLERIVTGKAVSAKYSRQMLEVMLDTQTGVRRVRGGLGPDVPWAHKTGTQYRRTCDFGVFFIADDHPVVFAIAVKGGSRRAAEKVMSTLAKKAYRYIKPGRASYVAEAPPDFDPDEVELLDPESRDRPKKKRKGRKKRRKGKKRRFGEDASL